ncbi:MAG: SDR family oxidoreductase [Novosphingobium sp.]|nr:SDR family oxidoreductase [Novosphingobium sp.]
MPYQPFVPAGTLRDKVILVTGASQGIGLVAAHGFALAGAKVALGARRGEIVQQAANAIVAAGGEAVGMALDVTSEDSVESAVAATVRRFGRIDGLFNNAGIDPTTHGGLADIPLDEWQRICAVKIDGTFLCSKHAIKAMVAGGNGGAIVNNGSCVSELAPAHVPAASSSQSAITGMTRSAAAAYGPDGIRTNMLATGLILTPERIEGYYRGQDERMKRFAPLRRPGTAQDVAQVAAWLLSDYSAYVNGAIIPVDGGYLAGSNPN